MTDSKTYYRKCGNKFHITPKVNLDLRDRLPVGTYTVGVDKGGYFLEAIDDFEVKGKLYGDIVKKSDRILRTFADRTQSTGVLLVGEKGSGKTLLAKHISITAAREGGIPTIVVNTPCGGDDFNSFLQRIEQPVVILFDEFEKVYKGNSQEKILTLFDGVYPSKKLFVLTSNSKHRIDCHMMNRPGRIYYMLEFDGLGHDFIREYCEDNLLRKDYIPAVCGIAALGGPFNFDMLKGMVEEMNRYDESPADVLRYLNIQPGTGNGKFSVKLFIDGERALSASKTWQGGPLTEIISIKVKTKKEEEGEECGKRKTYFFASNNLVKLDAGSRVFEFKNEAGQRLVLTHAPIVSFDVDFKALTSVSMQKRKLEDTSEDFDNEEKMQKTTLEDIDSDSDNEEKKLEAAMADKQSRRRVPRGYRRLLR